MILKGLNKVRKTERKKKLCEIINGNLKTMINL